MNGGFYARRAHAIFPRIHSKFNQSWRMSLFFIGKFILEGEISGDHDSLNTPMPLADIDNKSL
jgi:hypothetical protein